MVYKRRDIIYVDFGNNIGVELSGPHLAVVMSYCSDVCPQVCVCPLSSKKLNKQYSSNPFQLELGCITKNNEVSIAELSQIKWIDVSRVIKKTEVQLPQKLYAKIEVVFNGLITQNPYVGELITNFKKGEK